MTPTFFPYTYLSSSQFRLLSTVFGKIAVYEPIQAMRPADFQNWSQSGALEIRTPVVENDTTLQRVLNDLNAWAHLQPLSHRTLYKMTRQMGFTPPDPSVSLIRDEIKNRLSEHDNPDVLSSTDHARLFLSLAQGFDMQQDGLQMELEQLEKRQRALFSHMTGDGLTAEDSPGSREPFNATASDEMISERLSAWSRLLCCDPDPPCVFVTIHPYLFQMILEKAVSPRTVSGFNKRRVTISSRTEAPTWRTSLIDLLQGLTEPRGKTLAEKGIELLFESDGSLDASVRLTLCLAADQSPIDLFGNLPAPPPEKAEDIKSPCSHVVLALME